MCMDFDKKFNEMNGVDVGDAGSKREVAKMSEIGIFDLRFFSRNALETDGRGVITAMFNMTDDDGSFMTYDYRADSITESPDGPTLYTIDWSGDVPTGEIDQYEWFRSTIEEISGYVGSDRVIPMDKLPAPLAAFASIYLMPAEAWYTEAETKAANDDMDMVEDGYHFDDDRLAELRLYVEAVERDARARVGCGPMAHDLVRRCQRLLMLYSMEAPELIIRSEENKLAYTMVIHYRGDRVIY